MSTSVPRRLTLRVRVRGNQKEGVKGGYKRCSSIYGKEDCIRLVYGHVRVSLNDRNWSEERGEDTREEERERESKT